MIKYYCDLCKKEVQTRDGMHKIQGEKIIFEEKRFNPAKDVETKYSLPAKEICSTCLIKLKTILNSW